MYSKAATPANGEDLKMLLLRSHNADTLRVTVPKGLSDDMRKSVWKTLAGSLDLSRRFPQLYEMLLGLGRCIEYDPVIVADVSRTLPLHQFFGSSEAVGPGQGQLYRILTAYANLDRRTGYCQGMNFLCGIILAVGITERDAFYVFTCMMLRYGFASLYAPGLHTLQLSNHVLNALIARRDLSLFRHLQSMSLIASLFATPWTLSAFVSSPLPLSTAVVVMDVLLATHPLPAAIPDFVEVMYRGLSGSSGKPQRPAATAEQALPPVPSKGGKAGPGTGRAQATPVPVPGGGASGQRTPSSLGSSAGPGLASPKLALPAKAAMSTPAVVSRPEATEDIMTRDLPRGLIRAALVVLSQLRPLLMASTSLEESYTLLKRSPCKGDKGPRAVALCDDGSPVAQGSPPPGGEGGPEPVPVGPQVPLGPGGSQAGSGPSAGSLPSGAGAAAAVAAPGNGVLVETTSGATVHGGSVSPNGSASGGGGGGSGSGGGVGGGTASSATPSADPGVSAVGDPKSALVQFVRSLEALDMLDEYPAGDNLELDSPVGSGSRGALSSLGFSGAVGPARPPPHLTLLLPPPDLEVVCTFRTDNGAPLLEGSDGSDAGSGGAAPGRKFLCDGLCVPEWMLPRQFRALLNSGAAAITAKELAAALKSTQQLLLSSL